MSENKSTEKTRELTEAELSAISGGIALSPQGPGSEGFYHVGIWFDAA